ncbi:uncharacterized protein JCM6883_001426 [Sporobolomyces salmoneus]|uniref:uncharacterized protein n=1 Tax=Sporobolomyces salmoneus TaxID=183962 RepID=UPI00317B3869
MATPSPPRGGHLHGAYEIKKAVKGLVAAYEKHNVRFTRKRGRELSWIPILLDAVRWADTNNWVEMLVIKDKDSREKLLAELGNWTKDVSKKKGETLPSVEKVYDDPYIGKLLARSFEFYQLHINYTQTEAEIAADQHDLELNQSSIPSQQPLPKIEEALRAARRIERKDWESETCSHQLRRHVFGIISAHTDPVHVLEEIRKLANSANPIQKSLGRYRAPMGLRQSSMYYGRL